MNISREQILEDESGTPRSSASGMVIGLAWPNTYAVGMSSLGFHLIWQELVCAGFRVRRLFWESGALFCPENDHPLESLDLIAFSVAFELDYLHILDMIQVCGLQIEAKNRRPSDPLVMAGGVAVSVNRHPLYPFVDILLHGEGEALLPQIISLFQKHADYRLSTHKRQALLESLAELPGVELTPGAWQKGDPSISFDWDDPKAYEKSRDIPPLPNLAPVIQQNLSGSPLVSTTVSPHAGLGRRILAEIARGCPHHCTFCWLGQNCRAFCPRPAAEIIAQCEAAFEQTDCDSVGLISAAVGAHPEIESICEQLLHQDRKISFSSLRVEEIRPIMLDALVRSGQRGLTLAPETGSVRLRRRLAKAIEDEVFFTAIRRAQEAGLMEIKLYFMVGLPEEEDEDIAAIPAFIKNAHRIMLEYGRPRGQLGILGVNLGIYVPKPNTPLSQSSRPSWNQIRKRAAKVSRILAAMPNVQVNAPSMDQAVAQYILSNGGFESAVFLRRVWQEKGHWRSITRPLIRNSLA